MRPRSVRISPTPLHPSSGVSRGREDADLDDGAADDGVAFYLRRWPGARRPRAAAPSHRRGGFRRHGRPGHRDVHRRRPPVVWHQYDIDFLRRTCVASASPHLADLNAAGSAVRPRGRDLRSARGRAHAAWPGNVLLVLMVPRLLAHRIEDGGRCPRLIRRFHRRRAAEGRVRFTLSQLTLGATAVTISCGGRGPWRRSEAMSAAARGGRCGLRTQFSQTTARMIASSPVFGVGVGQYRALVRFMPSGAARPLRRGERAPLLCAAVRGARRLIGGCVCLLVQRRSWWLASGAGVRPRRRDTRSSSPGAQGIC